MESAETISAPICRASRMDASVFPTAVGPAMMRMGLSEDIMLWVYNSGRPAALYAKYNFPAREKNVHKHAPEAPGKSSGGARTSRVLRMGRELPFARQYCGQAGSFCPNAAPFAQTIVGMGDDLLSLDNASDNLRNETVPVSHFHGSHPCPIVLDDKESPALTLPEERRGGDEAGAR